MLLGRTTTTLTTLALLGALTLTGCTGGEDQSSDPAVSEDRGIDAQDYVDEYDEYSSGDTAAASGGNTGASPSSAQDDGDQEPGLLDDNTFVDHGTAGYTDTSEDPESTFGLDVDTGSYSVARTLLDQGAAVPPESIRAEEWVNAFTYDDPEPTDADLAITAETGASPSLDDGTELVRVAVSSRKLTEEQRPRLNVTLVVDRSGSMDVRDRLGLVRSSLALLANELRDDDVVSVVSFDDQAQSILPPTRVEDTDAILGAVDELVAGNSTNLEAGIRLGYEQARESFIDDGVNVVVLCSDGVANVGQTGPDSIVGRIKEEGANGIHLVTVGFGMGNYNDYLMEQLADLGDGFYSYVDTFEEAERLFGTELTTTMVPVASEARTQVAFDPEVVESYRLIGYENRAIADEDFEDMSVDAGELGPGHHTTALYEVRLADGVGPGDRIGSAALRWLDPEGEEQADEADIRAAVEDVPSASFALAATVADTAELLKGTDPVAGRGLTLAALAARAEDLVEAGVPGADELRDQIAAAERA